MKESGLFGDYTSAPAFRQDSYHPPDIPQGQPVDHTNIRLPNHQSQHQVTMYMYMSLLTVARVYCDHLVYFYVV